MAARPKAMKYLLGFTYSSKFRVRNTPEVCVGGGDEGGDDGGADLHAADAVPRLMGLGGYRRGARGARGGHGSAREGVWSLVLLLLPSRISSSTNFKSLHDYNNQNVSVLAEGIFHNSYRQHG